MAEIELNVLIKQCLDRRIDNLDQIQALGAWQKRRGQRQVTNRLAVYQSRCPNQAQASTRLLMCDMTLD